VHSVGSRSLSLSEFLAVSLAKAQARLELNFCQQKPVSAKASGLNWFKPPESGKNWKAVMLHDMKIAYIIIEVVSPSHQ